VAHKLPIILVILVVAGGAILMIPIEPTAVDSAPMTANTVDRLDLSDYSAKAPPQPVDLLFIHHSCGGQLFASAGPEDGAQCIYKTHPEGGGLRALLETNSYRVHEASYGSAVGEKTDIFDWLPKFRDQMDQVLTCDNQDTPLQNGRRNQIIVFKSCFPNNGFRSQGTPPGNHAGPDLSVWNARAAYTALLGEFRKQPDVLFVCMTAPPLAPKRRPQPLWKVLAKKILGRETDFNARSGPLARQFNNWLADTNGWLKDYPLNNVVVFDLYDILTGYGQSDFSIFPTDGGYDSHPSREGNQKAAHAFVPFLNRSVHRFSHGQKNI
jgi:hypothetical protein